MKFNLIKLFDILIDKVDYIYRTISALSILPYYSIYLRFSSIQIKITMFP